MHEQGHEAWAIEEFGAAFFRDKRHLDRLVRMASAGPPDLLSPRDPWVVGSSPLCPSATLCPDLSYGR
jgi:hypothetical protein